MHTSITIFACFETTAPSLEFGSLFAYRVIFMHNVLNLPKL